MYHRILVPLDGSPLAEAALPHATAIASQFQSSLALMQVTTPITFAAAATFAAPGAEVALPLEAVEAREQAAEEYLAAITQRPELQGISVQTEVVEGIPAREIVRRAKAGDVDMIVMSTHGRSGLGRLVFGSVANQVLREAGLPILLIRPTGQAKRGSPEKGSL